MTTSSEFEDARLILENAKFHVKRYKENFRKVWNFRRYPDGGKHHTDLVFDRQRLANLKPIVFDVSNNGVHCLDLAIASCARTKSQNRNREVHFPFSVDLAEFEDRLHKLSNDVPNKFIDAIISVRTKLHASARLFQAIKVISNDTKHWELIDVSSDVVAVAMRDGRDQQVVEVPREHFESAEFFRIYSGNEPLKRSVAMLVGSRVSVKLDEFELSPDTVFDHSVRFAGDVIQACEAVFHQ